MYSQITKPDSATRFYFKRNWIFFFGILEMYLIESEKDNSLSIKNVFCVLNMSTE